MNRILTVLTIVLIASLVTSCASMQPNQKKLIGTWKVVKIEKYNIPSVPAQTSSAASSASKASKTTAAPSDTSASASAQAAKFEEKLAKMIRTEEHSLLIFNADKTAVKETPGKTMHATWKLKKKGTHLVVDVKESGKKMDIDILHINDTSITAITKLPVGGLKVTYRKQKTETPKVTPTEAPKKK